MRRRWIQVEPGPKETTGALMAAGALGAAVGVVTFYLTRMLLAREPIHGTPAPRPGDRGDGEEGRGA